MPLIRVHRRASVVDLGEASTHKDKLTKFQVEKFTYLFNSLFDLEKNGLIEKGDMVELAEKMRAYCGWKKDSLFYNDTVATFMIFLECLEDQVNMETSNTPYIIPTWEEAIAAKAPHVHSISLNQWLNMWGRLCYGSAGISDFPIWVQMLPSIFFKVADRDGDGILSQDEYERFLSDFVKIPAEQVAKIKDDAYKALTAGGDYVLNQENFNFCFANFLLGRSIYGPGKFIFGVFDNSDLDEKYQVVYNAESDEEE